MTVFSMHHLDDALRKLSNVLDKEKCTVDVRSIEDGYSIDVQTFSNMHCPFHIEVTPYIFDVVVADRFAIGDVDHDDFDFNDIAISIASGHVSVRGNRGFLFRRSFLEVKLTGERIFYIAGRVSLSLQTKPPSYSSYILRQDQGEAPSILPN
ncbi:hypothetical protein WG908_02785 [Sphingobium sp. AN641]|uniref:hypothetical protein n=1 Tax=Sphingobium sp. AN641 TaxID=3133443 RepID=UPI0030BF889D